MNNRPIQWKNSALPLASIKPATYNPRRMTPEQKKQLKKSLDKFNLCDSLVVNLDGTLIGGHQRLKLLKERGDKEVDVRIPDRQLDSDEEKELNLRLNSNLGEFDIELLKDFDKNLLTDEIIPRGT